ncbi:MAG TPA: hypothetical protein VFE47_09230 [Tepidisphaeraceae bacterium]|nr:hypothetical protein [Tepidisphaeraceae bacterium]
MIRKSGHVLRPARMRAVPAGVKIVAPPKSAAMRKWIDEPDVGCIPTNRARAKGQVVISRKKPKTSGS